MIFKTKGHFYKMFNFTFIIISVIICGQIRFIGDNVYH